VKIRDCNTFDGSNSKKLRGFLLQCKLNFQSNPRSFQTKQSKVNYSLSFLKGTTLNYFEPYLADDPVNEPAWLSNYKLYVDELLMNFGPCDMMANAEIELKWLVMKDNHKATKFFVEFYQLTLLLEYNDKALYQRAYLAHLTNSRTSFRKSTSAIVNERENSWREISLASKQEPKNDRSNKPSPNPCQNHTGLSNSNPNPNSNSKEKEKSKASTLLAT